MISPWTEYIVHAAGTIRFAMFFIGLVGFIGAIVTGCIYATEEKRRQVIGKYLAGAIFAVFVSIGAHIVIPPPIILARIMVTDQLPSDADAEVVNELVRQVCKEAAGF